MEVAPVQVYNTLTKKKELFTTVVPGKVGMYLCGPTVYKPSHLGHMVGPVIFDTVKRYLVNIWATRSISSSTSPMWMTSSSSKRTSKTRR